MKYNDFLSKYTTPPKKEKTELGLRLPDLSRLFYTFYRITGTFHRLDQRLIRHRRGELYDRFFLLMTDIGDRHAGNTFERLFDPTFAMRTHHPFHRQSPF